MHILVFNGGSSSLSYKIFNYQDPCNVDVIFRGKAYRVGVKGMKASYIENHFKGKAEKEVLPIPDHITATSLAADYIKKNDIKVDAIGHRFVHGGEYFKRSALIDRTSLKKLERCLPLAPLHNPISLNVIKEAKRLFPEVPQYAVIDSAFHASIPPKAYTYPLPGKIIKRYKYRRYGFHGISYSYICRRVPEFLKKKPKELNMIVCHLGTGGASVTAVKGGHSVDTSMGSSPNSGLIMSTRSGDIDPMIIPYLMRTNNYSPQKVEDLLNKKSGLLGISGFSSDITDIIARRHDEWFGKRAQLAYEMYVHRLKSYIGSYVMVLSGQIDALVFTDDIGVNNPLIRESVCDSLHWAGIVIDRSKNQKAPKDRPALIQSSSSVAAIVTMPTEEELMICLEGGRLLGGQK
jgi:acetate kinase